MNQRYTQKPNLRPRYRLVLFGAGMVGLSLFVYSLFFVGIQTFKTEEARSATSCTSSIGGTYMSPDNSQTVFLSPYDSVPSSGITTSVITNSCSEIRAINQFITESPTPLLVTLTEFTARPQGMNKVKLEWATSSEVSNRYFTVERSKNLTDFAVVGNVPTNGNGSTSHTYELTDLGPFNGKSYYRLSQTDQDGKTVYFDPVMVSLNGPFVQDKVQVGPNPFNDHLNVTIQSESNKEIVLSIFDLQGKLVSSKTMNLTSGAKFVKLDDMSRLERGRYLLRVAGDNDLNESIRIIKR